MPERIVCVLLSVKFPDRLPVPPAIGKVRVKLPEVSSVPLAARSVVSATQNGSISASARRIPVTVLPEDARLPNTLSTGVVEKLVGVAGTPNVQLPVTLMYSEVEL